MRKRFRLNDKHPLQARLQKVWDAMDKHGIKLDIQRDGTMLVMDTESNETFEMSDADNGASVGHMPPVFEYKLTFEKEVKE